MLAPPPCLFIGPGRLFTRASSCWLSPPQLPTVVFTALMVTSNGLLLADMLLSSRSIVEPLLDSGGAGAWLLKRILRGGGGGRGSEDGVGASAHGYGLPPLLGIGGSCAVLVTMVLVSVRRVSEGESHAMLTMPRSCTHGRWHPSRGVRRLYCSPFVSLSHTFAHTVSASCSAPGPCR